MEKSAHYGPQVNTSASASLPTSTKIMISLQTLDASIESPILAIGACEFCHSTNTFGSSLYIAISLQSNLAAGRGCPSLATHSTDANKHGCSLPASLNNLKDWMVARTKSKGGQLHVWGNNEISDIAVLRHAMETNSITEPWDVSNEFCYRTLKSQNQNQPFFIDVDAQRSALETAEFQAVHAAQLLHVKQITKEGGETSQ